MRGNILIVEDEVGISSFLQTSLEREGFSVKIAPSGEDANPLHILHKIRAFPIEVFALQVYNVSASHTEQTQ